MEQPEIERAVNPALLVTDVQWGFVSKPERQPRRQVLISWADELIGLFHRLERPAVSVLTVRQADGSTGEVWMKRHPIDPIPVSAIPERMAVLGRRGA